MTTDMASNPVFTNAHILGTAALTAALTLAAAWWRLGREAWIDALGMAVAAGAAVFLFRASANMPQLNADGISGFSANDWLAPAMTLLFVTVYAAARPGLKPDRFAQARALAFVISLAVNVVTI